MQQKESQATLIYISQIFRRFRRRKGILTAEGRGQRNEVILIRREEGKMYDYENGTEKELIRRARRGDVKAFSRLYSTIYKELYKFALYMTKHPQDAEDAVSEAVISAYENMPGLKSEESFRSWMFTILGNQCKKLLKRNQKDLMQKEKYSDRENTAEFHEPDYAQWHDVKRAFELLDEEEQYIVAFSIFGGYQSDEIARMLGKNAATVRSRKYRALEKMRGALG